MARIFALPLLFLLACAPEPPGPELPTLPALPDLEAVDAAVRRQLRERHDFVVRLQAKPGTSAEGLAWGFGQLGKAYHAFMDVERARSCYASARSLDSVEFRWPYYLGHLERTEGRFEASSAFFEEALTLRGDDVPTLVWLAENELDQQHHDGAGKRFEEVLGLDSQCVMAQVGLARVALERGDFIAAVRLLEPALAAQPEASAIHYSLGLAWRGLGDRDRALSFFDRMPGTNRGRVAVDFDDPLMQEVSDLRESVQHHARRGMRAIRQGRFEAAVRDLAEAVDADPDRADTRYNLAASLYRLGRRAEARAELDELVERVPDYAPGRVLLARLLLAEGDLAAAEDHLQRALESDPDRARGHRVLGDLRLRSGRLDEALASYRRVVELTPDLAAARTGAAVVLIRQGLFAAAASELEASFQALPASRELRFLLARLLAAAPRGELRDGRRALELAAPVLRGGGTLNDAETVAMVLAELGRFDEAVRWQRAALERLETAGGDGGRLRRRLALYQRGEPCRDPWSAEERPSAMRVEPPASGELRQAPFGAADGRDSPGSSERWTGGRGPD